MEKNNFISSIVDYMEKNNLTYSKLNELIREEKHKRQLETENSYFNIFYKKMNCIFKRYNIKELPMSYLKNSIKAFEILHKNPNIELNSFIENLAESVNSKNEIVKSATLGKRSFFLWRGIKEMLIILEKDNFSNWEILSENDRLNVLKKLEKEIYLFNNRK